MSFMESMKLVIAYMLLFWHYFTIPQFCLIGEYRIQTYLSSDFSLNNRLCHVSCILKMYADEYVTGY